jgi:ribosomal protein L19E
LIGALDQWRRNQPDLPGRPEAIRRLIEAGFGKAKPYSDNSLGRVRKQRSTNKSAGRAR